MATGEQHPELTNRLQCVRLGKNSGETVNKRNERHKVFFADNWTSLSECTVKGWLLSIETTAYPLTQCDAVRTYLELMSDPPQ